MEINERVKEEHEQIETFAVYWAENNRLNPKQYPSELDAGEWDEQYLAWQS